MAGHVIPDRNPGAKLDPKTKQRRLLILGLGAAAVLVIFVATRGGGGGSAAAAPAAGAAATDPTSADGSLGSGSTFADNGGQAAGLGDSVTSALGDFSMTLQGLTDQIANQPPRDDSALSQLADSNRDLAESVRTAQTAQDAVAAVPTSAPTGAAAGKRTAQTILKPSAAHHGELSVYHVTPGKQPVYVRPASTAKRAGSPSGKAVAHHPAPKKTTTKRAPAHKAAPKKAPAKKKGHR